MEVIKRWMAFNGGSQFGVDGPSDLRLRKSLTQHAQDGQRLNDVSQRAEAHEKDLVRLGV